MKDNREVAQLLFFFLFFLKVLANFSQEIVSFESIFIISFIFQLLKSVVLSAPRKCLFLHSPEKESAVPSRT